MNSKPFSPILIPSNIYIRRHNPRSTIKIDVIELQNRDVYLWTRPCFERALSTAWKILTHHAGVSALEELGVSIVEHYGFPRGAPTTYQEVRNQTLVFLYGDTGDYKKGFRRGRFFPSFVVDDWLALGDDEQLGYFMRSHNYDLSDAKIALNSKLVNQVDWEYADDIPLFKLIHAILHQTAHAFRSFLLKRYHIIEKPSYIIPSDPERRAKEEMWTRLVDPWVENIGDTGYLFDSILWKGGFFYVQFEQSPRGATTSWRPIYREAVCWYRLNVKPQAGSMTHQWVELNAETIYKLVTTGSKKGVTNIEILWDDKFGQRFECQTNSQLPPELRLKRWIVPQCIHKHIDVFNPLTVAVSADETPEPTPQTEDSPVRP